MKRIKVLAALVIGVVVMLSTFLAGPGIISVHNPWFTDSFMFGECEGFSSNGDNPFFSLEPGFQLILDGKEDAVEIHLTITVLNETKTIAGVKTRVVEERETIDGHLFEVTRKYYAVCNRNNSVVYFGDDVDSYENGGIVGHEESWHARVKGTRARIIMAGVQLLGARYMQEVAP